MSRRLPQFRGRQLGSKAGWTLAAAGDGRPELLGDSWVGARQTLPLLGLQTVLIGVVIGASVSLEALGPGGRLVRVSLNRAPILMAGSLICAYQWGAVGAALGFVVAHVVGTAVGWRYLWRATAPEPAVLTSA